MNAKQKIGQEGEVVATEYLINLGYEILCKNFRCLQGEIDIIAKDGKELVFIEVKTRNNKKYGEAREAVDERKQGHIKNAIKYYLYKNNLEEEPMRMDVIEIYIKNNTKIIKHLEKAIE